MTIPWPDVPMTLFGADDAHGFLNVPLRWFRLEKPQDVTAYKEGYRRAAMAMADRARERTDSADYLVWPVTWLWRHYLELALKDIIARGPQLRDEGAEWRWPEKLGHRLVAAWDAARPFIVEHGDPNAPEIENVRHVIADFDRLDPSGMGFRYPMARDGTPSLAEHENYLNVGRIDETMQAIANFLDAVINVQKQALSGLQESAARDR